MAEKINTFEFRICLLQTVRTIIQKPISKRVSKIKMRYFNYCKELLHFDLIYSAKLSIFEKIITEEKAMQIYSATKHPLHFKKISYICYLEFCITSKMYDTVIECYIVYSLLMSLKS
ncbi:hypothetical protein QTP88_013232 [Uroleucon formosanum]